MVEDRVKALEERVSTLRAENAELLATVRSMKETLGTVRDDLKKDVERLTQTTGELTAVIERGRGALWIMVAAAGALGAILGGVAKKLLGIL